MKTTLVYPLGYDADSDAEFYIKTGWFICDTENPTEIQRLADHHWGSDWWGLGYESFNTDNLYKETKRLFK